MHIPNLDRLVETFILVGTESSQDRHFRMLRTLVAPLVRDLRGRNLIGWFSFLIHRRDGGVPTSPDDPAAYLHLRVERLSGVDFSTVAAAFPDFCLFTRPVSPVEERSLGRVDLRALVAPELATGWAILGASSEWALDLACAQRDDRTLPIDNVAQFLHYLGNQLLIGTTNIPIP
jgi:hypothetical protein